jgi:hypothetical protein
MQDPEKPIDSKILVDAIAELKEMGRVGFDHPSSKPVLIGGAIGAVAGMILFDGLWVLTLLVGAALMLYKRIRP